MHNRIAKILGITVHEIPDQIGFHDVKKVNEASLRIWGKKSPYI